MSDLLLICAAVGASLIIKYGFILSAFRNFIKDKAFALNNTLGIYVKELFSCCQCLGFWCGFFIFLIYNLFLFELSFFIIFKSIIFGFASSFIANSIDMLLDYIAEKTYNLQNNESKINKN